MTPSERSDILKAGAAKCAGSPDRWICWFCAKCIPHGEEKVVEEPGRAQSYYVTGAEGLAISCGCRS